MIVVHELWGGIVYFLFDKDRTAMRRKATPVMNSLPVSHQTTPATMTAGRKKMNTPAMKIIIIPMMTRTMRPPSMIIGAASHFCMIIELRI